MRLYEDVVTTFFVWSCGVSLLQSALRLNQVSYDCLAKLLS